MPIFERPDSENELDPDNDLFVHYDKLPNGAQSVMDYYGEAFDGGSSRLLMERLLKDFNSEGYTFDYSLDMQPFDLSKVDDACVPRPASEDLCIFESGAWMVICKLATTDKPGAIKLAKELNLHFGNMLEVEQQNFSRLLEPSEDVYSVFDDS